MTVKLTLFVGGIVCLVARSTVLGQDQSQEVSTVKASVRTWQLQDELWDTKVQYSQKRADANYVWNLDVDQNILEKNDCNKHVLETVLHFTAIPKKLLNYDNNQTLSQLLRSDLTGVSLTKPIPYGYQHFPGVGYYKAYPESLTWAEARKTCTREGAHLVIINSELEQMAIKKLVASSGNLGNWILAGILEFGSHGEWFTLFGEPLETTGFSKIYPGENNALGVSDFGMIHSSVEGYGDVEKSEMMPFICELKL